MASEAKIKIWKATRNSKTGFMVTEDAVVMAGSKSNYIVADDNGVNIAGSISLMCSSDQIRSGGLFVSMNDFIKMIPGTIVTPIPQSLPIPPVKMIGYISEMLPILAGTLS